MTTNVTTDTYTCAGWDSTGRPPNTDDQEGRG